MEARPRSGVKICSHIRQTTFHLCIRASTYPSIDPPIVLLIYLPIRPFALFLSFWLGSAINHLRTEPFTDATVYRHNCLQTQPSTDATVYGHNCLRTQPSPSIDATIYGRNCLRTQPSTDTTVYGHNRSEIQPFIDGIVYRGNDLRPSIQRTI